MLFCTQAKEKFNNKIFAPKRLFKTTSSHRKLFNPFFQLIEEVDKNRNNKRKSI